MMDEFEEGVFMQNIIDLNSLRGFSEMIPQGIFIVIDGRIIYSNKSGAILMGFNNAAEIKGKLIKEYIHPEYVEDFKKARESFINNEKNGFVIETRVIREDGIIIDIEASASEFIKNGEHVTYLIIKNITEAKRTSKLLTASVERYKTLIEMLPDAIVIRDKEKILYANSAAIQSLGCNKFEEVAGRDIDEFISPRHPDKVSRCWFDIKALEKGYVPFVEVEYIRKSDGAVLMTETAVKFIPNQRKQLFMVVVRDISERRYNEELKKDMVEQAKKLDEAVGYERLRTEFFANISHEFKTPLNVILSALQLSKMVLREPIEVGFREKVIRYNSLMQQNCYRLVKLVNNLIDITRIDAGFFNITPVKSNIVSIVEDITLSVKGYIENKGISLTFDTEEEEIIVLCDPEKIERIMLNLLSNALKFTNSGGSIMVNVQRLDGKVLVSVKDTGIGISEDKKFFIFDRFRQVDKSLSRKNEGSGIGLALVKSLVEMHGGNIRLNSIYKEGSEFVIEIPINDISERVVVNSTGFLRNDNQEKIEVEFSDIYL